MAEVLSPTIKKIVNEVKKLNELEQEILLKNLRLKKYRNKKTAPVADYDSSKIKPPTMEQINKWVHEVRKDPRYVR